MQQQNEIKDFQHKTKFLKTFKTIFNQSNLKFLFINKINSKSITQNLRNSGFKT